MVEQPLTDACSFCRKVAADVRKLIAGPGVAICDECVDVCVDIIKDSDTARTLDLESKRAGWQSPQWSGGAATVYCTLCRLPFPLNEALLIEGKGALCYPCVSQVQALSTEGAFEDEPEGP